ncbi:hypothetical protein BSLG_004830 [Batrachochytrium salamandrivorans]|nr:hypothetical protein BSLG_004830 [Batrachochytrium salamandrivorans]
MCSSISTSSGAIETSTITSQAPLNRLPAELILDVADLLDSHSLRSLASTCSAMRKTLLQPTLMLSFTPRRHIRPEMRVLHLTLPGLHGIVHSNSTSIAPQIDCFDSCHSQNPSYTAKMRLSATIQVIITTMHSRRRRISLADHDAMFQAVYFEVTILAAPISYSDDTSFASSDQHEASHNRAFDCRCVSVSLLLQK